MWSTYALIWADDAGKVTGGGFTTAAVPADWRVPAKVSERAAKAEQVSQQLRAKTDNPAGFKGWVNVYCCDACLHDTVTIDVDDGVTPFMIGCTTPGCTATAKSSMYRVDQDLEPTHEWHRPSDLSGLAPIVRTHIEMGGLVLRERIAA